MLDVESQKKQIKKYLKYCNKHKGGMEESALSYIDRLKVTRHVLKLF